MKKEVERGRAPRDIERVDKPHVAKSEPHVHYKDGTASNQSGSPHHGKPNPNRAARD